jgi:hypothetical protein
VRYIYVDEAGTSAKEPITVVAGVIVHADIQYIAVEKRLHELIQDSVPAQLRDGFIFHAKEVWSDRSLRKVWSFDDRLRFLKRVMAIPREMGLAVSLGMVRRDSSVPDGALSREKFQHVMAFFFCIGRADKYIRDHAGASEVATVVAEDVQGVKDDLRKITKALKDPNFSKQLELRQGQINLSQEEISRGIFYQESEQKVERIRDTVHFVSKADGPLLQLADACAFAFRRYFARESYGDEFVRAILGEDLVLEDWVGPASGKCFFWHPGRFKPTCRFLPVWRGQVS